ncbi:MAG: hypothetical protein BZY88_20550 [SAR202 cluster bacterium Io17-Chloro-G9]|nr:MAG: hypothetical protein BZY88_20550 [SAR202 cluster bacterium Io17-Chloro-G9]
MAYLLRHGIMCGVVLGPAPMLPPSVVFGNNPACLEIVTLSEVKGLGREGVNAPHQMFRRCGWLNMTAWEQLHFRGGNKRAICP